MKQNQMKMDTSTQVKNRPVAFCTKAELQVLSRRNNLAAGLRLLIHFGAIAGGIALVAITESPWLKIPEMILLGFFWVTLFAPMHECAHLTAFKNPVLCRFFSRFCGAFVLVNADFYRSLHMAHHRYTQIKGKDPELFGDPPTSIWGYVRFISGVDGWWPRIRTILDFAMHRYGNYNFLIEAEKKPIRRSILVIAALQLTTLVSLAIIDWRWPLLYWFLPQLMAQPILNMFLLAEHTYCDKEGRQLEKTRTTLTNPLVKLFMWNMSFHTEHHQYPNVPFHALPRLHRKLKPHLKHVANSYLHAHGEILRAIRNAPKPEVTQNTVS